MSIQVISQLHRVLHFLRGKHSPSIYKYTPPTANHFLPDKDLYSWRNWGNERRIMKFCIWEKRGRDGVFLVLVWRISLHFFLAKPTVWQDPSPPEEEWETVMTVWERQRGGEREIKAPITLFLSFGEPRDPSPNFLKVSRRTQYFL